ncbi:hypothetical protein JMJ35_004066 [Cladonia borealis]|uniref:Non-structural maintenance of chromosomes element 4 n=1 Tax=Cladonia borealis TaxID=184061 RepID=A0AA39R3G3_9LECA|nr:hypothetical protein JMJ35_004066 [Cladonia borealis]
MARRAQLSEAGEDADRRNESDASTRRSRSHAHVASLSPSPAASFSSDKENRQAQAEGSRQEKGKGRAIPSPHLPSPATGEEDTPRPNKRRKLSEREAPNATQTAYQNHLAEIGDSRFYDPDQSMGERRALRKEFRDLSKELTDSRAELLAPSSKGLYTTIEKANALFSSVKQTSDATLDSRLLVSTADLSAKRTTQLNIGDSTTGIDVDDFVGRCITFMRRAPGAGGVQRRRRDEDDSDEDAAEAYDEGDEFNWEWLGRQACFPSNVRPPVPGFLLGPLSVQKRARKATQRRERLQKRDPKDAVRPEELNIQDMEKVENSNLTTLCRTIRNILVKTQSEGPAKVLAQVTDDTPEEVTRALMTKYGVADDEGVPFFHFVVNPKSFGQTVENIFYVSFLIRDGAAGFGNDSNMLPTLHATEPRSKEEIQEQNISKQQAVFQIDFEWWENIIDAFEIEESIIPHRVFDEEANVAPSGWYA